MDCVLGGRKEEEERRGGYFDMHHVGEGIYREVSRMLRCEVLLRWLRGICLGVRKRMGMRKQSWCNKNVESS